VVSEQTLEIDWTRCDGHGLCSELVPERIDLDDWGFPIVRRKAVGPDEVEGVRRAVAVCPALALRLQAR
jgi:ferredoxin